MSDASDKVLQPFSDAHDRVAAPGSAPQVVVVRSQGGRTVWWLLTVVLAVIATALVTDRSGDRSGVVLAQPSGAGSVAGARGVYAFTGQLTSQSYGLFMMDVDSATIWCYELQRGANGELQLRLVAARSWMFDRYLEEYNVAEPIPSAVQAMVEQQRVHRETIRPGVAPGAGSIDVPDVPRN